MKVSTSISKETYAANLPENGAGPATRPVDVSIIIVNYNVRDFLDQALQSVRRAGKQLAIEVIVVDNNSVDGSVEMLHHQYPQVQLIINEENIGFARANNQGIRHANGTFLLILNPDTILQEDTIDRLVQFMEEHPDAGAAGCQIFNPDGTFAPESRRAFPRPSVAFYRITGLSRMFPKSPVFGQYNMTYLPVDKPAEVDALSGSCMMVRREALYFSREESEQFSAANSEGDVLENIGASNGSGAGLLDEHFFMYGEDLDWCYRIQQAGWKIYYTPATRIIHYKGESTKKGELLYVRLFYGAMLRFTEKHFNSRRFAWLLGVMRAGIFLRAGTSVLGNAVRSGKLFLTDYLAAIVASIAGIAAWGLLSGTAFSPTFFITASVIYSAVAVGCIGLLHGYDRMNYPALKSALAGVGLGFIAVSVVSFFIKELAFSRGVVLFTFACMAVTVASLRIRHLRRQPGTRRAILVGPPKEARRFAALLRSNPSLPLNMVGYVDSDQVPYTPGTSLSGPQRLGSLHQIRDIVRLHNIHEIIFASDGLKNQTIFELIQKVRNLPVHTRMLAKGREHLIGKASINNLAAPSLIKADFAVGSGRTHFSKRMFDVSFAITGALVLPLVFPAARLLPQQMQTSVRTLERMIRQSPGILFGRRTVVGYRPADNFTPPDEWRLQPGVVSILEILSASPASPAELHRMYWFYAKNQSAWLDLEIIYRILRRSEDPHAQAVEE